MAKHLPLRLPTSGRGLTGQEAQCQREGERELRRKPPSLEDMGGGTLDREGPQGSHLCEALPQLPEKHSGQTCDAEGSRPPDA